jgi:Reverse transcriptase (RNA-dependent DNA polymerase)
MPLIADFHRRLQDFSCFSSIDLTDAFNNILSKEGHEWKTAFHCIFGVYEYHARPFRLSNAPATVQRFMNGILGDMAPENVFIYLDNVLIATKDKVHNVELTKKIPTILINQKLYGRSRKREFFKKPTKF